MIHNTGLKNILFIASFLIFSSHLFAQQEEKKIVQFSGNIVSEDYDEQISFASIRIKNTYRGTIASEHGFFSIAVPENDTIIFTAVGFKKREFVIPAGLSGRSYTVTIKLERDTVMMKEVQVYPWPSREKFKEAFLNADVPEDDEDRALENLNKQALYSLSAQMVPDGSEGFKSTMGKMTHTISHYNIPGFVPVGNTKVPSSLMNPVAWAQFIKALKDGDFKKKQ